MVYEPLYHALQINKVLGLVIQNNLKWNNHIESIVTKASKRLHILRILRRGGVEINDLVTIYTALIRSLLEYCCEYGIMLYPPTSHKN